MKSVCISFFLILSFFVNAQNIGVGASGIYNFQTESFGAGLRVNIFPNKRLSFVPQFSLFSPFSKIKEFTAGLGIEYKVIQKTKFNIYGLLHGGYNSWANYEGTAVVDAKQSNLNLEGGVGVSMNTCLRPFIELRYNVKFQESHLDLGFIYIFGCRNNGHFSVTDCPKY